MSFQMRKMKVVSIGCGNQYGDGIIGLDKGDYGQDYVRDMRRGLPFDNESVDKIIAESCLEHIPNGEHFGEDDFIFVMNECLRVLKIDGTMEIIVPIWSSQTAHKDPTHYRFFAKVSFTYLEAENTWQYGFKKGWKVEKADRPNEGEVLYITLRKVTNEED